MELDDVFIDGAEERKRKVSTDKIANLIGQYVSIEQYESMKPRLITTDEFDTLSPREQTLVAFFANELVYRNGERQSRLLPTNDFFNRYALDWDDHYPYFRDLERDGIIERRDPRVYALCTERLTDAFEEVKE